MSKANLYSIKTGKMTKIALPKEFSVKENKHLLAQALHVYRVNSHTGTARVKGRGEVARTTAKWFRQKGTGHARHGARSAPIFVGGGVAHGPKGTNVSLVLPAKMRQKARAVALSMKAKDDNVMVVDGLSTIKNTKGARKLVEKLGEDMKGKKKFIVVTDDTSAKRALQNFKNVRLSTFSNLNAYSIYFGGRLVLDKAVINKEK